MSAVYVVAQSTAEDPRNQSADCYFRSDSGPMGFGRNPALWTALVDGAWVYDRKTAAFARAGANGLAMVRRNMRPFAVALFPASEDSTAWVEAVAARQQRSRIEATRARLRGDAPPSEDPTFGSSIVDIEAIRATVPPDCEGQIWRFGDRGEYCTLLTGRRFDESRLAHISGNLGVQIVEVTTVAQVPAW